MLSGEIPNALANCHSIVELQLQCNQIKGPVPDLKNCQFLRDVRLYDNELMGSVPSIYWQELTDLQVLSLSGNALSNAQEVIKGFDKANSACFLSI